MALHVDKICIPSQFIQYGVSSMKADITLTLILNKRSNKTVILPSLEVKENLTFR